LLGGALSLWFWMGARFLGYGRPKRGPTRFVAGFLEEFPEGSLQFRHGVWIVRDRRGLYAMENLCPHLGCHPRWNSDQRRLECPCHGSLFDEEGNVLRGPAKRPLRRVQLTLVHGGRLVVDLKRSVERNFRLNP